MHKVIGMRKILYLTEHNPVGVGCGAVSRTYVVGVQSFNFSNTGSSILRFVSRKLIPTRVTGRRSPLY